MPQPHLFTKTRYQILRLFVILVAMALLTVRLFAQADLVTLTIVNNSPAENICHVFMAPLGTTDWGLSRLGETEIIPASGTYSLTLPPDYYHVLLANCEGQVLLEQYDLNVNQNAVVNFPLNSTSVATSAVTTTENPCDISFDTFLQTTFDENAMTQFMQESGGATPADVMSLVNIATHGMDELNKGAAAFREGRYEEALVAFETIQTMLTDTEIINTTTMGRNLSSISLYFVASALSELGQYTRAIELYNESLAVQMGGEMNMIGATILSDLAAIYRLRGEHGLALDTLNRAIEVDREAGRYTCTQGIILNNIGMIYLDQGQLQIALGYLQDALAFHQSSENLSAQANTTYNLGEAYEIAGQYAMAQNYYKTALDLWTQAGGDTAMGTAYVGLGRMLLAQGNYEQALHSFDQGAYAGYAANNGFVVSNALFLAATVHIEYAGDTESGRTALLETLRLAEALEAVQNQAGAYTWLAYADVLDGDLEAAQANLLTAISLYEKLLDAAINDNAIRIIGDEASTAYDLLAYLYLEFDDKPASFDISERSRAFLTRTEMAGSRLPLNATSDAELMQVELGLRRALDEAQKRFDIYGYTESTPIEDRQKAEETLREAQQDYEQHRQRMETQGGLLARQAIAAHADSTEISAALPHDAVLILYDVGTFFSIAHLLYPDGTIKSVTLPDEVMATQLNELTDDHILDRNNRDKLGSLYDYLIRPLQTNLQGVSQLIIVPDGPLHLIPFAALYDVETGTYLIDEFAITMMPSGTTLVQLQERGNTTPALTGQELIVANAAAPGLATLANADREATEIARLLGVAETVNVAESLLHEQAANASLLHISAHAQLNTNWPMLSVIHLGADAVHNGRLEVREIYGLGLAPGMELVVLSGCETGVSTTGNEFGLLNQAFLVSGAQRVVASLWNVNDKASADLLIDFMARRQSGNYSNDATALQAAILALKEDQKDQPYLWASFVLTGLP